MNNQITATKDVFIATQKELISKQEELIAKQAEMLTAIQAIIGCVYPNLDAGQQA